MLVVMDFGSRGT